MNNRASIEPKRLMRMLAKSVAVIALCGAMGGCAALPAIEAGAAILGSIPAIASLPDKISNFFKGSSGETTDRETRNYPPKIVTEADFLRGGNSVSARGDFVTAAWFYGKAADANPNSLQARMRLANAQMALKDETAAYTNYQAALMLSPSDADAVDAARRDRAGARRRESGARSLRRRHAYAAAAIRSFTTSSASPSRCRANTRWRGRASRSG